MFTPASTIRWGVDASFDSMDGSIYLHASLRRVSLFPVLPSTCARRDSGDFQGSSGGCLLAVSAERLRPTPCAPHTVGLAISATTPLTRNDREPDRLLADTTQGCKEKERPRRAPTLWRGLPFVSYELPDVGLSSQRKYDTHTIACQTKSRSRCKILSCGRHK